MKSFIAIYKGYAGLFLCGSLLFFVSLQAGAQEIKIADVLITNNAGQILVYARATGCFTKNAEAAIFAGVPTTLIFYLDFYQERPYWWDKRLARCVVKHTIKYDNVEKNFQISSTHGQQESVSFQSYEYAKRAMAELNGVAVYPVSILAKDRPYYLKMKANKNDQVPLPLRMQYLSFFTSLRDFFGVDWQRQKISYRGLMAP